MILDDAGVRAQEDGVSFGLAFKRELGAHFLGEYYARPDAIGVLQGGGALAHVYGSPRYSVDLDFAFEGEPQALRRHLEAFLPPYLSALAASEGRATEATFMNPRDPRLVRVKLLTRELPEPISLLLEFYGVPSHSHARRPHPRQTARDVAVEDPVELLADKVKAILGRLRRRRFIKWSDIFDLAFLVESCGARLDPDLVMRKFADYGEPPEQELGLLDDAIERLRGADVPDRLREEIHTRLAARWLARQSPSDWKRIVGAAADRLDELRRNRA